MLRECLQSLLDQRTDDEFTFDVVVVDNNSTDDTKAITDELAASSPVDVTYCFEKQAGQICARHAGFAAAKGEWIANFDDDEIAEPDWVLEMFRFAREKSVRSVGGLLLLKLPDDCNRELHPRVRRVLGETVTWERPQQYTRRQGPGSGNQMIHRSVLDEVGLYDLRLAVRGYDTDHYRRMYEAGIESWFVPTAVAYHVTPEQRLTDHYLTETCFHDGWVFCNRDLDHYGKLRSTGILLARCANAAFRHLPIWLVNAALAKKETALAHRLMLSRAEGYLRCYLKHCIPVWPQEKALRRHGLAEVTKQMAG
jgi:glycosyltransferase involved in cell wall biosynthesis